MRATYEVVRPVEGGSLRCMRSTGERFSAPWHFHPEIELMFVERSRGLRFVGDSVEPFREGELVMTGPNLPHVWINHHTAKPVAHDHAIGICVQFREDFLGEGLWRAPEFATVANLFRRSGQGLLFTGSTARAATIYLRRMVKTCGAARLAELFLLLEFLAAARDARLLATSGYVPKLNQVDATRIHLACRYVHEHLAREIHQPVAAKLAGLSPATFSSFFHEKMGRTFSAYVTHLRVARAIHFMVEEDMKVSEAAFASGFNNLSNFNAHFRAQKGMTPRAYLQRLNAGSDD